MAHKTLIGGTVYEIKGGKTLVDGTAYEIKSGKTLVGGTAYDVGFGGASDANVKVTVSNSGMYASMHQSMYAYLNIDEVRHDVAEELVLPIGTVITCTITAPNNSLPEYAINLNGTEVAYTSVSRYLATYSYTVTGDVEIDLSSGATMGQYGPEGYKAYINITEL